MKKTVAITALFIIILSTCAIADGLDSIIPDASIWGMSVESFKEVYPADYEQCQVGEEKALCVSNVGVSSYNMDVYYVFGEDNTNSGLSRIAYILNDSAKYTTAEIDDCLQTLAVEMKKIEGNPDSEKKSTSIWKKEKYKIELGKGKLSKYTGSDISTVAIIYKKNSISKSTNMPTHNNTPRPSNSVSTPRPSNAVSYSTNTKKTVKNGNSGVYSYIKEGYAYDNYYIIDFDNRYVYFFSNGDGSDYCERVKMVSGDLNSVLIITYHDGNDVWSYGLHFKWVNQPNHLILQDNDGFEYDYYTTDLDDALKILKTKRVCDY